VSNALVRQDASLMAMPQENEMQRFMPVMSLQMAVERRRCIVDAVQQLMKKDTDFGTIPGTPKPTLYQPGADKLNNLFGLVPRFSTVVKMEDWTGEQHGGEPFFHYEISCSLWRGDYLMGEGVGSCNSWEKKYRWRKAERVCPHCGKDSIIKGKSEYGGGYVCFAKKGGCNAKFKDGDKSIEGQEPGNKPNPEIFDLVNTVLKMASKRAKIAATLNATSAHEFFTQDVEDIGGSTYDPAAVQAEQIHARQAVLDRELEKAKAAGIDVEKYGKSQAPAVPPEVVAMWKRMDEGKFPTLDVFGQLKDQCQQVLGDEPGKAAYYSVLKANGVEKSDQFKSSKPAKKCARELWEAIQRAKATQAQHEFQADDSDLPEVLSAEVAG
jgi:hypothetical protein